MRLAKSRGVLEPHEDLPGTYHLDEDALVRSEAHEALDVAGPIRGILELAKVSEEEFAKYQ